MWKVFYNRSGVSYEVLYMEKESPFWFINSVPGCRIARSTYAARHLIPRCMQAAGTDLNQQLPA
jgi:hypothetical protein